MSRILLVIESDVLRRSAITWLAQSGHESELASAGEAAVALARSGAFSVVVVEESTLTRGHRQRWHGANLAGIGWPLVVLLNEREPQGGDLRSAMGAFEIVSSPLRRRPLLDAIARASDHAALRRRVSDLESVLRIHSSTIRDYAGRVESLAGVSGRLSALIHTRRNNPLHEIQRQLTFVRTDPAVIAAPHLTERLAAVENETDAACRLLNMILDIPRLEAVPVILQPDRVQIAELVRTGIRSIETAANSRNVRIAVEVPDDLWALLDRQRFEWSFDNLLSNGVRHAAAGGLVRVGAARDRTHLSLAVENDGPRPAAPAWFRLFEKYVASAEGDGKPDGWGLGLYYCRLVAEAHGGIVSVEDGAGSGVRFRIAVPVSNAGRR